ncbi:hypothetical protein MBRA1_000993 [Malassezia brasiliensis]|uniref:Uncharacterized protein n=1 Tax=Malassezia brasiliensis TaxID=1821822 RepID=A0AAF0DQY9_9BASI|nr:hypothetical protein MBRA1_000993 [Malassezia brasiliensis]
MLNDVMSLVVALYAVRLKNKAEKHPLYSYGWQRAEILGALFNGVFLLALCFSIFMEALERIVKVPEVSNPKLIVIVGSMGLSSNIIGLALFQGHGHAHGPGGHSHEGHDHEHEHEHNYDIENQPAHAEEGVDDDDDDEEAADDPLLNGTKSIVGYPARARAFIVDKAHSLGYEADKKGEQQALLQGERGTQYGAASTDEAGPSASRRTSMSHEAHTAAAIARHRRETGSTGHSHENMNMTGVFLHVLGDAIGNVGVILTGLFIWNTDYAWRFYVDPMVSFLIACIIFHSALPLVKSASFILLQGVPHSVSIDGVRQSVLCVEGVLSLHDLHVWQLNENKIVASLHILVDCSGEQVARYMEIANQVRHVLHLWGIHSTTIQPEFVSGVKEAARLSGMELHPDTDKQGRVLTAEGNPVHDELPKGDQTCLLACDADECRDATCCKLNRRGSQMIDGAESSEHAEHSHSGHSHTGQSHAGHSHA